MENNSMIKVFLEAEKGINNCKIYEFDKLDSFMDGGDGKGMNLLNGKNIL